MQIEIFSLLPDPTAFSRTCKALAVLASPANLGNVFKWCRAQFGYRAAIYFELTKRFKLCTTEMIEYLAAKGWKAPLALIQTMLQRLYYRQFRWS